jgi:uncharacterized protein YjbJ (UPF0337 family)
MNRLQFEGNWNQFKGKVKQQWGQLTNDDLDIIEGSRDELIGKIQERYGYSLEKAKGEVDAWERRH